MRVKNLVLGIGIVVVFALALWQGIEAFYPSPQYDDFCSGVDRFSAPYPAKADGNYATNCTFSRELQEQQTQCYADGGQPIFEYDDNGCTIAIKECDFCQKYFDEAQDKHAKYVFFISLIVAVITIIVGYSILSIEPVGSALIGSGIWAIFYGSVINWRNFSNIWRFLLLLLALILLIWFAVRLNTREEKGFWQKLGFRR